MTTNATTESFWLTVCDALGFDPVAHVAAGFDRTLSATRAADCFTREDLRALAHAVYALGLAASVVETRSRIDGTDAADLHAAARACQSVAAIMAVAKGLVPDPRVRP